MGRKKIENAPYKNGSGQKRFFYLNILFIQRRETKCKLRYDVQDNRYEVNTDENRSARTLTFDSD